MILKNFQKIPLTNDEKNRLLDNKYQDVEKYKALRSEGEITILKYGNGKDILIQDKLIDGARINEIEDIGNNYILARCEYYSKIISLRNGKESDWLSFEEYKYIGNEIFMLEKNKAVHQYYFLNMKNGGTSITITYLKRYVIFKDKYLLLYSELEGGILRLKDMEFKRIPFWGYRNLGRGILLLRGYGKTDKFLRLKDMKESDWISFKKYENLGGGILLLKDGSGKNKFLRLKDMKESEWIPFKEYDEKNHTLISRYGSKIKFNQKTLKTEGSWFFD